MPRRLPVLLLALAAIPFALRAQDVHFSQFTMSPLMLNPANTGAYSGSYRIGGIYRDQWAHFSNSFQTPAIYLDAPIVRGFRQQDWLGVGVNFFQDKAGVAGMRFGGLLISGGYHLALQKSRKDVITFGFGGGNMNRRIDLNDRDILLEDELKGPQGTQSMDRSGQGNVNYVDLNAGILYTRKFKNGRSFRAGVSVNHLNRPQYRIQGGSGQADRQPMRISFHSDVDIKLNEKWSVTPALLFQNMSSVQEIQGQALAGYLFDAKKEITLHGGLGYRLGDAIPLIVGATWKTLRIGASWDYNVSDVTPWGNGGFELAASYIVKIYKKPTVKPVIICPRF